MTPFRLWTSERADVVGVHRPQPPALDHRRAAHPERRALGGDDQVRRAGDHRVAREAAARDDRDPGNEARQAPPQREGSGLERRDDRVVGVARPPSPALGEEDGRQAHPLDQLEQPVLLLVPEGALRAGEDRVVVGEDGARAALVAEVLAVDPGRPGDQAVGGRSLDQLGERSAPPLRGDRVAPVLDERARVDQVLEVLAGGPAAGRVAALDRLGSRLVAWSGACAPAPRRDRGAACPWGRPPQEAFQSFVSVCSHHLVSLLWCPHAESSSVRRRGAGEPPGERRNLPGANRKSSVALLFQREPAS